MGAIEGRARRAFALASAVAAAAAAAAAPAGARVLATNGVAQDELISNGVGVMHCQVGERMPRGTRAVQISLHANTGSGPVVAVAALVDERAIAGGVRAAGWNGSSVVVPLRPAPRRPVTVTLCMTTAPEAEVGDYGREGNVEPPPGQPTGPRVQVAYLDRVPAPGGDGDWRIALAAALLRALIG